MGTDSSGPAGPPATGRRLAWPDAPAWLRAEVEARLGGPVVEAATQPGGRSSRPSAPSPTGTARASTAARPA